METTMCPAISNDIARLRSWPLIKSAIYDEFDFEIDTNSRKLADHYIFIKRSWFDNFTTRKLVRQWGETLRVEKYPSGYIFRVAGTVN